MSSMYDFNSDFANYQKLVPNADLIGSTPAPPTYPTDTPAYDFNKDLEGYRKIAPDTAGLEHINDPLIIKQQMKEQEMQKKKLKIAADLMTQSGYQVDPETVSSAQLTEGARKDLAGMQDKVLSKAGVITQRFGNKNPIEKYSGGVNYGTDIGVPVGTKVSVPPGQWKVVEAFSGAQPGKGSANRGYGNSVLVQNQETGEMLRFSHLSEVGVKPGEIVSSNKIVAKTGITGNTTGPHLDLEMYDRSGRLVDILNTPYSSYLGLGQGGGPTTGAGGGNPLLNKITQVGRDVIGKAVNQPVVPFIPQTSPKELFTGPNSLYAAYERNPKEAMMSSVMGMSIPQSVPSSKLRMISNEDRDIMGKFVTMVEEGNARKILGPIGNDAQSIAEGLGLDVTQGTKSLAKKFNMIIEAMDKQGIKPKVPYK